MFFVVKMGQIVTLFYTVLANPPGAAASDEDGATNPKQSMYDAKNDSGPSGSDNETEEPATKTMPMTDEIQSAKADEEYYIQSHLQYMPGEVPIQSHGAPGPPRTATITDTNMRYSMPTIEHDQLPSYNDYAKPSHSPKESWMPFERPGDGRFSSDLNTDMKGECSVENQIKKEKRIRFKEKTKQAISEDMKELIRQTVKEKFAFGKPDDVKFFDAAIVYDKEDYDKADDMRLEMKQIIRDELQEDLHIELFDSENFNQSMLLVVEDVVNRTFVILVYLSRNTDKSVKVNLFVEEAVGLTRLTIAPPGSISDRQYLLKPVHTEPPERRNYKTPVGLVTMNGIDWYDKYSKFTRHKIVEMMKSAIEKRKRRNRKDKSPIQTAAHRIQRTTDNIRAGQSAFTQGPHQTWSTDSRSLQVTNISNLGNRQYANAPCTPNALESDLSMSANQGSAFSSYRSSTQMTYESNQVQNNADVGISTTRTACPERSIANQRGYLQQPDVHYANCVPVVYDQQQIYERQANAMPIFQPEMSNYLLLTEKLQYYEPPQDNYRGTDHQNHAHSHQVSQPRVQDYADIVNLTQQTYQYPPETYLTMQQFRRDNQHITGHVSDPRYDQQIQARDALQPLNRQPPIGTQFQAGKTWQQTPHQLPTETQFKARETTQRISKEQSAEAQYQAGDSWQPKNRLPPAYPVSLSHDGRSSTDRNFDTELFSDLSTNDVEIDTRPNIVQTTNFESCRKSKRSRKKKTRRKEESDSDDDRPLGPFQDLLKSSGGRPVNIIGGKITQIGNNNKVNMRKEYANGKKGGSERREDNNNVLDAEEKDECFQREIGQSTKDLAKGCIETTSNIYENLDVVNPRKPSAQNKEVGNYCGDKGHEITRIEQKQQGVERSSESIEKPEAYSSLPHASIDNEAVSSGSELFGSGSENSLPSGSISSSSSARTSFKTVSSSIPSNSFVSNTSIESGLSGIVHKAFNMNINGYSSTEMTVDSDVD